MALAREAVGEVDGGQLTVDSGQSTVKETREQRIERLCGEIRMAMVERREVSPTRADMYVQRVREKEGIQDQEMELMYLAMDFRLMDVIAE